MSSPIDTNAIKNANLGSWHAELLASHNGVNLKYRVMRDTSANFHVHHEWPECFFVISGHVTIDTENASHTLGPGQFFRVEQGVSHRARVEGEATLLVFDANAP